MKSPRRGSALLRAAHPGPAFAVTVLAAAYAASAGLPPGRLALVTAAVLTSQLSIGWSNDLVDARRDRTVGRTDKPLATGEVPERVARAACGTALAATVVLSLACGPVAGAVNLVCTVAGWVYNLGMKSTLLSWLPYAVAFGGLPLFVSLAGPTGEPPAGWVVAAGALLGVGAHLVNVLPDLHDDEVTGVRGLPHRLGPRWTPVLAVAALAAATVLLVAGASAVPRVVLVLVVVAVGVLALAALVAGGRAPFRAAIGIALVDVLMLVVAG